MMHNKHLIRLVTILLVLLAGQATAFAQTFSGQLGTIPASDGAELRGNLAVQWNDELATSARLFIDSDAKKEEIEGFAGSLLATTTSTLEISLRAIEYAFDLGDARLAASIGGRYYREAVDEAGVFRLEAANQQFSNIYGLTVFGPDIGLTFDIDLSAVEVGADVYLSPIGFYLVDQEIEISPLIDGTRGESSDGPAFLFTDARLDLSFFDLVGVQAIIRSVGFDIDLVGLGSSGGNYVFVTTNSSVRNTETTLVGSLLLSLQGLGTFEIGGGYRWSSSQNLTTNAEPTVLGEPVFSFNLRI